MLFDKANLFFRPAEIPEFFDRFCPYRADPFYFLKKMFFGMKDLFRITMLQQDLCLYRPDLRNHGQGQLVN